MSSLALHPNTKISIDSLVDEPKQSIMIVGDNGAGKHHTAMELASRIIKSRPDRVAENPYVHILGTDNTPIKIENIRSIQQFIKLKVPKSTNSINRIILIENAGNMTIEAQNALLKMLEEPPEKTMFILTATSSNDLLDTISSRTTKLPVLPISKKQALDHYSVLDIDSTEINKAYAISGGKPALLDSLISDKSHPLLANIEEAKQILFEPLKDRLARVDSLAKDKVAISKLFESFLSIAHAALYQASITNNVKNVKVWHKRQELVTKSMKSLQKNANTKLLLDDLFLNL